MSSQHPLNEAEAKIEQTLQEYMQRKTSCQTTWYQKWLPLFFSAKCTVNVTCYSGSDLQGRRMADDSTGVNFSVHISESVLISEQDRVNLVCGRDSVELKKDARHFARQLQPVLQLTDSSDWIQVEYTTEVKNGITSYSICERTIRFSVSDTSTWALTPLRTTNSAYRTRSIKNWEELE